MPERGERMVQSRITNRKNKRQAVNDFLTFHGLIRAILYLFHQYFVYIENCKFI